MAILLKLFEGGPDENGKRRNMQKDDIFAGKSIVCGK